VTDFPRLLAALAGAQARFIIVGGAAATAHGSARLTLDLDIVYDREPDNLQRISRALAPFSPYLRGAAPGLPFVLDADTLQHGLNFTLSTSIGALDLLGEIAGGGGYEQLRTHAVEMIIFGEPHLVLGLDKLIQVKRAAGRLRDLETAAELEVLREEKGDTPENS
jgi:hypothetical protein